MDDELERVAHVHHELAGAAPVDAQLHDRDALEQLDGDRGAVARVVERVGIVERQEQRVVVDLDHESAQEVGAEEPVGPAPQRDLGALAEVDDRDPEVAERGGSGARAREGERGDARKLHVGGRTDPLHAGLALELEPELAGVRVVDGGEARPGVEDEIGRRRAVDRGLDDDGFRGEGERHAHRAACLLPRDGAGGGSGG